MRTLSPDTPLWGVLSLGLVAVVGSASCVRERDPRIGEGAHPLGWSVEDSPTHHSVWLRANGDDLARCRQCHGDDYRGGPVAVSCAKAGCHEREDGPEACGTCHGEDDDPRPETGAHEEHGRFCAECHVVPEQGDDVRAHITDDDEGPDVVFSGLALANDAAPAYEADADQRCAGTYCHVAGTPEWEQEEDLECDGCHAAPPDTHARFASIAQPPDDCQDCHNAPEDETHVDGNRDIALPEGCGACHGDEETGAPPPALDHDDDADPGIGAHQRHLDPDQPDRVAPPVACTSCHVVPTEQDVLAEGHIDDEAPADVSLIDEGAYDYDGRTCAVWCHADATPEWDAPTEPSACDACHDAPPPSHALFARVAGTDESCEGCHPEPPADTHVNHVVDFDLPDGCGACHGTNDLGYPPVALDGSTSPTNRAVGAHATHLDPSPSLFERISAPLACSACHAVDDGAPQDYLFAATHIDEEVGADVVLADGGTYSDGLQRCSTSCHWARDDGPYWTDVNVDLGAGVSDGSGPWRQCGSCHGMPPLVSRDGDPHPATGPDLADCVACHVSFSPATHVNGEVDY